MCLVYTVSGLARSMVSPRWAINATPLLPLLLNHDSTLVGYCFFFFRGGTKLLWLLRLLSCSQ